MHFQHTISFSAHNLTYWRKALRWQWQCMETCSAMWEDLGVNIQCAIFNGQWAVYNEQWTMQFNKFNRARQWNAVSRRKLKYTAVQSESVYCLPYVPMWWYVQYVHRAKCSVLMCNVLMWEGLRPVTASSMCQFWGEGGVLASLNCPPLQCFEMLSAMHCVALHWAVINS